MKKRFIILVIVAITLSLIGLVSIQLYWINSAVSVKEVYFDRGVSEAVGRAISKYNKLELTRRMLMQREKGQQMNELFFMLDSLNQEYYRQVVLNQTQSQGRESSLNQGMQIFSGDYDEDPFLHWLDSSFFENRGGEQGSNTGYIQQQRDQFHEDPIAAFFERSRMINDLFDNMFTNRYTFQTSSDESVKTLDSLLSSEFQSHGIKTQYEFGIYNPVLNILSKEKSGNHTQQLLQSQYVYSLFPNDIFLNPEYLVVYFPEQKQYILSQMNTMLATSTSFHSDHYFIICLYHHDHHQAKETVKMKTAFINNMTHEFKTPISTISLACQALSDKDVQKSENLYQSYINMINEENIRLGSMTEKVLQTAVIEKGRMRLNTTGLDIHDIILNAIQKIGLQVEARNGKISTNLNAEYSFIKADKIHLTNVFFNLLDNANKYSPVNPQIDVITENNNNGVLVHVKDNGIGISRVNQKKIFDNLYRVSTGNIHDVKGFGLGLGYVKAITEQHGGWVTVSSEPKKGSRFTVFIPFGFNSNEIQNHTN
jgi:two-component system, OmpR family, phosphate regulon sensor histidine kinase PhoR